MKCQPNVADGSSYFLYHSIGMFPGKGPSIGAALEAFARLWGTPDDSQWPCALAQRQKFIDLWRDLIHAPAGTLTTAENVTTALYSVIGSLPERYRKRRLLVAADCFPSLHFLLSGMAQRHGFVLDTVPLRPGERWVREEDILARWDDDVGVALLTQVTSIASYRCNLPRLMEHGRRMGTAVGVDITQGIGLLPYDVNTLPVDFTVSTTLKWLCGTSGAGIVHMRDELLRECHPELRGWFSQENIFSWDIDAFAYASDARRFDHGTPSVLACVGSLPALEWHAAQDRDSLLAHNRQLSRAIIEGAAELGLPLACPQDEDQRGGSLMLQLPSRAAPAHLIDGLRAAGIYADCRGTILRLSPGNMTTPQGVGRLLDELASLLGGR